MDTRLPKLGDSMIAVALLALVVTGMISINSLDLPLVSTPGPAGYALIVLMTLPVAWRQIYPRTTLWVVFVAWSTYVGMGYADSAGVFGLIVAMYTIGAVLERRHALMHGGLVVILAVAWTLTGVVAGMAIHVMAMVQIVIALVVPLEIGLLDRNRYRRLTELELEHSKREQALQSIAADAVRTERARIARELHDVVAHEVTVMTLQAEGAKRISADTDPRITESLRTISASGRKGLAEMQRMIGVLRASEIDAALAMTSDRGAASTDPATPRSSHDQGLSPMPSLASLPDLVAHVESAGLPVALHVTGEDPVPAGVELSAYRIIQESLTNCLKHAGPGAAATVTVACGPTALTITVDDDGRGAISDAAADTGGYGLTGIRERVHALGGDFTCGPRTGGGFRVKATLPTGARSILTAASDAPQTGQER